MGCFFISALKKPVMAKQCLAEAIVLSAESGATGNISLFLKLFGDVARLENEPERAVRLVAAALALSKSSDKTQVEARYRESLDGLDMDDEQLAEELRAGRAMMQEQAVAYALEASDD